MQSKRKIYKPVHLHQKESDCVLRGPEFHSERAGKKDPTAKHLGGQSCDKGGDKRWSTGKSVRRRQCFRGGVPSAEGGRSGDTIGGAGHRKGTRGGAKTKKGKSYPGDKGSETTSARGGAKVDAFHLVRKR